MSSALMPSFFSRQVDQFTSDLLTLAQHPQGLQ
jgi:hypothetical protein